MTEYPLYRKEFGSFYLMGGPSLGGRERIIRMTNAVALARFAMQSPELVPAAHGALCPLVGCKDYGCWAAHEGTSEPPS
jgi:hypothetical protein